MERPVSFSAEDIRDEKGTNAHVKRCPVHIDGRAQRKDERSDISLDPQLRLDIFHIDRKRTGRRAGGEADRHSFRHAAEECERAHVCRDTGKRRVYADSMDAAADRHTEDD